MIEIRIKFDYKQDFFYLIKVLFFHVLIKYNKYKMNL